MKNNKRIIPISSFEKNQIYEIRVKPNSSKQEILRNSKSKQILVFLHSPPENNKANEELIKIFKKHLKLKIKIVKGLKSRNKLIQII